MESFDKKLKEKLEQIPDVNPEMAWARFAQFLPKPWYTTFLKSYAGWGFATIVTAVLISQQITIDKLEQKLENQTSQFDTKTLEKSELALEHTKVAQKNGQDKQLADSKPEESKNSTLVPGSIEKNANTNFRNLNIDEANLNIKTRDEKNIKTTENKEIISGVSKNINRDIKQTIVKQNKEESSIISAEHIEESIQKPASEKNVGLANAISEKNTAEVNEQNASQKNTMKEPSKEAENQTFNQNTAATMPDKIKVEGNMAINDKATISNDPTAIQKNSLLSKISSETPSQVSESTQKGPEIADKQVVKIEKNIEPEIKTKETTISEKTPENAVKIDPLDPTGKLSDFKPKLSKAKKGNLRLGLETQLLTNGKAGIGLVLEYMFGSHFSLASGIAFNSNHKDEFKQPQEFNKRTGKRFEDYYRPYLGDKKREIKNIEIRTTAAIIPLKVNYYYPLKYNFSVFGTAGMAIKIYEKDDVVFEGNLPSEDVVTSTFENKRKSKPISNFSYGLGVQYTYKKLVLQFQPNFNFPTQKSFFLNERNRIGVDAGLRFSFGK